MWASEQDRQTSEGMRQKAEVSAEQTLRSIWSSCEQEDDVERNEQGLGVDCQRRGGGSVRVWSHEDRITDGSGREQRTPDEPSGAGRPDQFGHCFLISAVFSLMLTHEAEALS